MKVLVTGHEGYIGSVLAPLLLEAGHHVIGLDTRLFRHCDFGEGPAKIPMLEVDLRSVGPDALAGFDAIVHLAGISNVTVVDVASERS